MSDINKLKTDYNVIVGALKLIPSKDQWPKERDKRGGKSGAASGVNLGKAFGAFKILQSDAPGSLQAIANLRKSIVAYNAKAGKSYPKVQAYLKDVVLKALDLLKEAFVEGPQKQKDEAKKILDQFSQRRQLLKTRANELGSNEYAKYRKPFGDAADAESNLKKLIAVDGQWMNLEAFKNIWTEANLGLNGIEANLRKEVFEDTELWDNAEEHWDDMLSAMCIGELNTLIGKYPDVTLAKGMNAYSLIDGLLKPVKEHHRKNFDKLIVRLTNIKSPEKAAKNDPLTKECLKQAQEILKAEFDKVNKGKGTANTKYLIHSAPAEPTSSSDKKTGFKGVPKAKGETIAYNYGRLAQALAKVVKDPQKLLGLIRSKSKLDAFFQSDPRASQAWVEIGDSLESVFRLAPAAKTKLENGQYQEAFDQATAARKKLEEAIERAKKLPPEAAAPRSVLTREVLSPQVKELRKVLDELQQNLAANK